MSQASTSLQVRAADRFGTGIRVGFPHPAMHFIVLEGGLDSTTFVGKFLHLAADEERKRVIGRHGGCLPCSVCCSGVCSLYGF